MKKLFALVLALVMVMSLATTAFAQTVAVKDGTGNATITVENPARGETYSVVKLFDANVTGNEDGGSIYYTGTIPEGLKDYFETKNTIVEGTDTVKVEDYIVSKTTELSEAAIAAMKTWAESQTAVVTATSDGTELVFTNLPYGYYIVTSTQGTGAISVTSTNPNGTIVDKNVTEPSISKLVNGKKQDDVTIGDTVTYTVDFTAPNYLAAEGQTGADAELVYKYEIYDTLPEFLQLKGVVSVIIDQPDKLPDVTLTEDDLDEETVYDAFDEDKTIVVPWATKETDDAPYVSLYANGSIIKLTYTAVVISDWDIIVDGEEGNINTVTIKGYTDDETPDEPWEKDWKDTASILTYAAAFRKVDEAGNPLYGAQFKVAGLTLKETYEGLYEVISYDPTETEGTTMITDKNGYVVIEGLDSDETLSVIETVAPAGYNKLTEPVSVTPVATKQVVESSCGKVWYDEDGNVVDSEETAVSTEYTITTNDEIIAAADGFKIVNKAGAELPETGGMGTTLLYVLGTLMVLGSGVLLVTKKRMSAE